MAFTLPFLLVLAQAAFMRVGYPEPYPALMMPDFAGTRTSADGSIDVTSIAIDVRFDDGAVAQVPMPALLAPMPRLTMMQASNGALRGPEPASTAMIRWLRGRLAELYPDRRATDLEVQWYWDAYRVDDGVVRRVARVPDVTYHIDLTR
jgi:hypothetical protein